MNLNLNFELGKNSAGLPTVFGYDNEVQVGFFTVTGEGMGTFRIEQSEIEKEYRGKGLYKLFILAAFDLIAGLEIIRSHERNLHSNYAYIKWTGVESLDPEQIVWIQKAGNRLEFTIDEE